VGLSLTATSSRLDLHDHLPDPLHRLDGNINLNTLKLGRRRPWGTVGRTRVRASTNQQMHVHCMQVYVLGGWTQQMHVHCMQVQALALKNLHLCRCRCQV